MIFDVVTRSLTSPKVLIPVEQLLGDAQGARMPQVQPACLTAKAAEQAVNACPTAALALELSAKHPQLVLNYAACIGCGRCIPASDGALVVAARLVQCGGTKTALVQRWNLDDGSEVPAEEASMSATAAGIRSLVGRALNIRQLDAGSCNGCEGEIAALGNPYYDLERFGIHFVASPKHADMLLVTGPVTRNMAEAVKHTYEATPCPRLVIAVGACGCSGGIFGDSPAVAGAVDSIIPVDGYIPGCPPSPAMLLTGILNVLQRRRFRTLS
jgi:Ni,Fe-hydrogenase III small subunit/NAD-dependent dihydropyrimidine dehydrogenase PreA subunit